jgi:Cu(I)/Ag(I) efflux system membrane protein CusA/SilA
MRDFRSDIGALSRVLVPVQDGKAQISLAQLADINVTTGPSMIRDEDGMIAGYVYVDVNGRDAGDYVREARAALQKAVRLPYGYTVRWSGEYEAIERVQRRLMLVIPITLALVFLLLYANTRSVAKTSIVALAVPFSAIGAFWFLYLMGYNMSIAVWVGLIALLGVDAETGVFMLLYLDLAYEEARRDGRMNSAADLRQAILAGAVKRIRPKFMTVSTTFLGLVPILWATGAGSDVMKRIAAPMIGGVFTSFLLELLVYPVVYQLWKWHSEVKSSGTVTDTAEFREAVSA